MARRGHDEETFSLSIRLFLFFFSKEVGRVVYILELPYCSYCR